MRKRGPREIIGGFISFSPRERTAHTELYGTVHIVTVTILYLDNFDVVKVTIGSGSNSDDENNKNHRLALPDVY